MAIEFGHGAEQRVERIGHQLLRRAAADGAGETKLEMALRVEAQRERRLALAARSRARRGATRRDRSGSDGRRQLGSRSNGRFDRLAGSAWFFSFRLVQLGGLVDILAFFGLAVLIVGAEAVGDFGLLVVDRRLRPGSAPRSDCAAAARRALRRTRHDPHRAPARSAGFGRLEAHVVPAEILETGAALAEALGPHRRAGRALAGQQARRERRESFGFALHLRAPYWPTTRRPKPPTGRGLAVRDAGRRAGRGEHGAAEILFEPVGDIIPQLDDLAGRAAAGVDLHHRAAVDHRGGEIGAVVKRDRGDGAVLRQRDRGLVGDLGLGRRGVDDEDQAACRRGRTNRRWRRRRAGRAGSDESG